MWQFGAILFLCSVLVSTSIAPNEPGHTFLPMGKLFPSYNSWAISVSTNTSRLIKQVRLVEAGLRDAHKVATLVASSNFSANSTFAVQQTRLTHVLYSLDEEARLIKHAFPEILSTSRRHKRGLINGIGSAMSYMFGTATETEISHLQSQVNVLGRNSKILAHSFNGTLAVLNHTQIGMVENRNQIIKISKMLGRLDRRRNTLSSILMNATDAISTTLLVADFTDILLDLTQILRKLHTKLTNFEAKIALAKVGILHAHLIHPDSFKQILRQIETSLPNTLALPFSAEDIDSYIRIIKPKVVHTGTMFHFLLYIPLLHVAHSFNVFKYFGYEVPHSSKNVSLKYESPANDFIMVSEDGRRYILPENNEIQSCLLSGTPFCQLHEPAYSMSSSTSCLVALYRKQKAQVYRLCPTLIQASNREPLGYYLGHGQWLLVSTSAFYLTIYCQANQTSHTTLIKKRIETIQLDAECSASSDTLFIPPYYFGETLAALPSYNVDDILSASDQIPIWRPEWNDSLHADLSDISLLPRLPIHGLPAIDYFDLPTSGPLTFYDQTSHSFWVVISVVGLFTLCSLLHVCYRCACRYCRPLSLPSYAPAAPSPPIELEQFTAPLRSESPPPSATSPGHAADQSTATSPALRARTSVRPAGRLHLFSVPADRVRVTSRSHTLPSGTDSGAE